MSAPTLEQALAADAAAEQAHRADIARGDASAAALSASRWVTARVALIKAGWSGSWFADYPSATRNGAPGNA